MFSGILKSPSVTNLNSLIFMLTPSSRLSSSPISCARVNTIVFCLGERSNVAVEIFFEKARKITVERTVKQGSYSTRSRV